MMLQYIRLDAGWQEIFKILSVLETLPDVLRRHVAGGNRQAQERLSVREPDLLHLDLTGVQALPRRGRHSGSLQLGICLKASSPMMKMNRVSVG